MNGTVSGVAAPPMSDCAETIFSASLRYMRSAVKATVFDALVPHVGAFTGMRRPGTSWSAGGVGGRIGALEIGLAMSASDVRRAQRLRYRVFYEEMSAVSNAANVLARRDMDTFDPMCDHLLVIDHRTVPSRPWSKTEVVGTYRLLRQSVAERCGGFYTAREYAVDGLVRRHRGLNFLELGRSCVLAPYRTKRIVELLWQGIWSYVAEHRVDVLIGCASFDGTDPDKLARQLSYLHHYASAPEDWRVSALSRRYVEMNRVPKARIDPKGVLRDLPPLIKGYLRLGAFVGQGAVIDRQFGTTDVLIVLPVAAIRSRYIDHFGSSASA